MPATTDLLSAVHFHRHDPGERFDKDSQPALEADSPLDASRILTPNVVRRPDGGFRMYYTGLGPGRRDSAGYILSAVSDDGERWSKEGGVRVDSGLREDNSRRSLCPDVIPLPDGGLRMYFEGRGPDGTPSVILSAVSADGLTFELEPGQRSSRFGPEGSYSYGTPRVLYFLDQTRLRFRMYYHRYTHPFVSGVGAGNHILSAVSNDGLEFVEETGVRVPQETPRESYSVYAPEVLRLGSGGYRMFYAAWSEGPPGGTGGWNGSGGIAGGLFTAVSADGLLWCKSERVVVELGGEGERDQGMVSEPCMLVLPDGRARLLYECCDATLGADATFRILSATTESSALL